MFYFRSFVITMNHQHILTASSRMLYHGSWVILVMGQVFSWSHGSWVTRSDPSPTLVISTHMLSVLWKWRKLLLLSSRKVDDSSDFTVETMTTGGYFKVIMRSKLCAAETIMFSLAYVPCPGLTLTPLHTRWCNFEWPWTILSDLATSLTTWNIAQPLCDSWTSNQIQIKSNLLASTKEQ